MLNPLEGSKSQISRSVLNLDVIHCLGFVLNTQCCKRWLCFNCQVKWGIIKRIHQSELVSVSNDMTLNGGMIDGLVRIWKEASWHN
jgi:hypothetical protein